LIKKKSIHFIATRTTKASAKARALERSSDTGKARSTFNRLALQQSQRERAMEYVPGGKRINDIHHRRINVADLPILYPKISVSTATGAYMTLMA
jgi:hypothetical protein